MQQAKVQLCGIWRQSSAIEAQGVAAVWPARYWWFVLLLLRAQIAGVRQRAVARWPRVGACCCMDAVPNGHTAQQTLCCPSPQDGTRRVRTVHGFADRILIFCARQALIVCSLLDGRCISLASSILPCAVMPKDEHSVPSGGLRGVIVNFTPSWCVSLYHHPPPVASAMVSWQGTTWCDDPT